MSKSCREKFTAEDFRDLQKVIDESCSLVRANETRIRVRELEDRLDELDEDIEALKPPLDYAKLLRPEFIKNDSKS